MVPIWHRNTPQPYYNFLLHPRKIPGAPVRQKKWCDENSNNIDCDIDQWRHNINIVYIVIDDACEPFQQTLSIKQSKTALKLEFLHIWILGILFTVFLKNQLFIPKKNFRYLKSWQNWETIPINLTTLYFTGLRASYLWVLPKLTKSLTVPYSTVPFFILLAFRSFITPIERKISRKTGSHYDSKSYSAMLKSVESKKYTLSARHHHMCSAINPYWFLKIMNMEIWHRHVTVPVWIQQTENITECWQQFYYVNFRRYAMKVNIYLYKK